MCFSISTNLGLKIIFCVHSQHLQIHVGRDRSGLVSECASKNVSLVLRTTHTHTHTHTRCPPGRPVSDPEDTASHQGITVLWALCCYTDCLAFGDLSVWDNTILSRQGENTYFGCFSQHQKRPPITLHGDVLLKKKAKNV